MPPARAQYYPSCSLVLVTNHHLSPSVFAEATNLGWKILYWRQLVERISARSFAGADPLVKMYLDYVRQVCNMVELRPLKFDATSLYSLVSLTVLIEELVGGASHDDFAYRRSPFARDRDPRGRWGAYYRLTHQPSRRDLWAFFGVSTHRTT
jgi:hypothetical protein